MNRAITASGSPHDSTDARRSIRRPRLVWLDFFRGAAVLVMIETHVVNTFMADGLRAGDGFAFLNYANGLVAPSFLFIAGFVQGMERRQLPGKPINYRRRGSRLLGIGALGYAMHFPVGQLLDHQWSEALRVGSQVDVLQCLALGLGLLLGVGWLTDRWKQGSAASEGEAAPLEPSAEMGDGLSSSLRAWLPSFRWSIGVAALATFAVLVAPLVHDWAGGSVALRAWVNRSTGSLFPIFPWVGFVFLGALAGAWPERPAQERAAGMVGLAVLAWFCRGAVFSATSPSFFLERAVWVLALAAMCEWIVRRPLPGPVLYAGKHSLKLYVTHLALITALVGSGVRPTAFGLAGTVSLLAGVAVVSFAVTRFLEWLPQALRQTRPAAAPGLSVEDLPSPAA